MDLEKKAMLNQIDDELEYDQFIYMLKVHIKQNISY